jgi:hypothetical protein
MNSLHNDDGIHAKRVSIAPKRDAKPGSCKDQFLLDGLHRAGSLMVSALVVCAIKVLCALMDQMQVLFQHRVVTGGQRDEVGFPSPPTQRCFQRQRSDPANAYICSLFIVIRARRHHSTRTYSVFSFVSAGLRGLRTISGGLAKAESTAPSLSR